MRVYTSNDLNRSFHIGLLLVSQHFRHNHHGYLSSTFEVVGSVCHIYHKAMISIHPGYSEDQNWDPHFAIQYLGHYWHFHIHLRIHLYDVKLYDFQ